MSNPALKLDMISRVNPEGKRYYFTTPDLPVMVDLSRVVVFLHPSDDGTTAELVFKKFNQKRVDRKRRT